MDNNNGQGMEFRLVGGALQPVAEKFSTLEKVRDLDAALFAITSIDTASLRTNPLFLSFLDSDKNAKIRTDELKAAISFMLDALKDGSGFEKRNTTLQLDALNPDTQIGADILKTAQLVLRNLGKEDATEITLEDISNEQQIKSCALCNGDGVISADTAPENAVKTIEFAILLSGGQQDLSGVKGINAKQLDDFIAAANALLSWYQEGKDTPALQVFGENTLAVCERFAEIKQAVNDYFLASETLAFLDSDPERLAKKDTTADAKTPAEVLELLKKISIAAPDMQGELDLAGAINPLWKTKLLAFFKMPEISEFVSGNIISMQNWQQLSAVLAPVETWIKRRPDHPALFGISQDDLKAAVSEENIAAVKDMIAQDIEAGAALNRIETLHKLMLYQGYMQEFLQNFLNLTTLFEPGINSLLQTGTLVMDGRHFSLAVPVSNLAEHKNIATGSNICVAYVEITRGTPGALKKQLLAVAITSGNMRNLFPGKRGVFFDAAGDVYDARITDFLRQPVSFSEALKSPFLRLGEFLGKQADKMLAAKSTAAQQDLTKAITSGKVPAADPKGSQSPNASMLLMGGGIGIAAIGSSVAFIVKSLQNISLLNILAVLAGIMLAFGGPIVIASLVKLYRRNLGRFLEASGCSLNFPLRLSGKLGSFFTQVPKRPADSRITFGISGKDPIPGHKISLWLIVLFLVIALTYCILCFTKVLPFPPWKKKEVPCSQVCNKADDNKKLIKTAAAPAGKSVKKTQSKASPGGN